MFALMLDDADALMVDTLMPDELILMADDVWMGR